jgi:HAD superfamily hydrolase (TIGR01509 family)
MTQTLNDSTGPNSADGCTSTIPAGIEAVIFDFDGTLADTTTSHEQALRAALRLHSLDLDPTWYRRHVGLSIHDLLAALPGAQHLPHDEIIQHSRAQLLASVHKVTPIACVLTLLHTARRAGLPCAIASGASRLLVDPGIDALGLRDEFTAVVTREDVAHGKPAPDLYLAAARRLGVPPRRCLAVDDAYDGLTSARAASIHVLTVVDGHLAAPGERKGGGAALRICRMVPGVAGDGLAHRTTAYRTASRTP